MACSVCSAVRQFVFNTAIIADHILNWVLLGDPNETVSARTARARNSGSKTAAVFCRVLTFTFRNKPDHCSYALSNTQPSVAREIWDWNSDEIIPTGVQVVSIVEKDK